MAIYGKGKFLDIFGGRTLVHSLRLARIQFSWKCVQAGGCTAYMTVETANHHNNPMRAIKHRKK